MFERGRRLYQGSWAGWAVCGLHSGGILLACRESGKAFKWRKELEGMEVLQGGEAEFIPRSATGFPILGKSSGKMHFRSVFLISG